MEGASQSPGMPGSWFVSSSVVNRGRPMNLHVTSASHRLHFRGSQRDWNHTLLPFWVIARERVVF